MPRYIGLDFETYGAVNLPTHGLDRYVSDLSFQALIASACERAADGRMTTMSFDFVEDRAASIRELGRLLVGAKIVAHNAGFEQRVLEWLGIRLPSSRFIDSAAVARGCGAASRLEAAAPQLLGTDKMEEGRNLIKLFSIPGKYQEDTGSPLFDARVAEEHPDEWRLFKEYCGLDAQLGLRIYEEWGHHYGPAEEAFQAITMDMNRAGWRVDVAMVEEMQRRYRENQEQALADFRASCDAAELNLNSLKQLKEWTAARGVKCVSFDEKHVERYAAAVRKKLLNEQLEKAKADGYYDVLQLLTTKQILGGSSLKKLKVILNTVGPDGRLRDQYLHVGAGQSWRTTGRSVQMQNLKRLGGEPDDVDELVDDEDSVWDNGRLAQNLRQVFTATETNGRLIVGDFSSVEARGLAWMAGEEWKLEAFRKGQDLYKVSAARQFSTAYDLVTRDQRQFGKVGELSCGYQAGPGAVQSFAAGMGVELSEAESTKVVTDWRDANPRVVEFWQVLDGMLHDVVEGRKQIARLALPDHLVLKLIAAPPPASLVHQHPDSVSVLVKVVSQADGQPLLKRFFHGCYIRGRNVCYYKPSDRKTGDLWRSHFVDPKTKQVRFYDIYGGKLAGILTQSLCRELFFRVLRQTQTWAEATENVQLVGQFHDEIVGDWKPGQLGLDEAKSTLSLIMSDPGELRSFPLAADIKDDYRYTK